MPIGIMYNISWNSPTDKFLLFEKKPVGGSLKAYLVINKNNLRFERNPDNSVHMHINGYPHPIVIRREQLAPSLVQVLSSDCGSATEFMDAIIITLMS